MITLAGWLVDSWLTNLVLLLAPYIAAFCHLLLVRLLIVAYIVNCYYWLFTVN